ncbi:Env9p [Sugiyamaella lignohabitans]|uniref:Env9p n=1 Tax=Sugiyamaella lignohabitans TaxID=796027 RepID=A0A167CQF3_9ASCO|nr:Env9p [Sugiyamaella lignohabitans]ANB11983.1 Env9p [Sugiyamaella lignohabitans]
MDRAHWAIRDIQIDAILRKPKLPDRCEFGELKFLRLDLTSLQMVMQSVQNFKKQESSLDLLINNAGVMGLPYAETEDGFEIQTQTDHIGPFLFTIKLISTLRKSKYEPRIVFVSSIGHYMATRKVDLSRSHNHRPNILWTWPRYGNAKTANIHTTIILSELYPDILSLVVHPGFSLQTGILSYWKDLPYVGAAFSQGFTLFNKVFGVTPEQASYSALQAAISDRFSLQKGDSGKYLVTYGAEGVASRRACSYTMARQTWQWTANELKSRNFL